MIAPQLVVDLVKSLTEGKKLVLIVATPKDAEDYHTAIRKHGGAGAVTVLCASENNGRTWKRERFDELLVDKEAMRHAGAQDLVNEALLRTTPVQSPDALTREQRRERARRALQRVS